MEVGYNNVAVFAATGTLTESYESSDYAYIFVDGELEETSASDVFTEF